MILFFLERRETYLASGDEGREQNKRREEKRRGGKAAHSKEIGYA